MKIAERAMAYQEAEQAWRWLRDQDRKWLIDLLQEQADLSIDAANGLGAGVRDLEERADYTGQAQAALAARMLLEAIKS